MSCKEISADWAAQRIKGLSLTTAVWNALFPQRAPKDRRDVVKTLHRLLPLSAPRPRHDVGGVRRNVSRRWAATIHMGSNGLRLSTTTRRRGQLDGRRTSDARREASQHELEADHVISSAPMRQLVAGLDAADVGREPRGRRGAAISRFPHRRPDPQGSRRRVGQLDLHPRSRRARRPRPELQVVVARDGAGPGDGLLRAGVFLLRERRGSGTRPTPI